MGKICSQQKQCIQLRVQFHSTVYIVLRDRMISLHDVLLLYYVYTRLILLDILFINIALQFWVIVILCKIAHFYSYQIVINHRVIRYIFFLKRFRCFVSETNKVHIKNLFLLLKVLNIIFDAKLTNFLICYKYNVKRKRILNKIKTVRYNLCIFFILGRRLFFQRIQLLNTQFCIYGNGMSNVGPKLQ